MLNACIRFCCSGSSRARHTGDGIGNGDSLGGAELLGILDSGSLIGSAACGGKTAGNAAEEVLIAADTFGIEGATRTNLIACCKFCDAVLLFTQLE